MLNLIHQCDLSSFGKGQSIKFNKQFWDYKTGRLSLLPKVIQVSNGANPTLLQNSRAELLKSTSFIFSPQRDGVFFAVRLPRAHSVSNGHSEPLSTIRISPILNYLSHLLPFGISCTVLAPLTGYYFEAVKDKIHMEMCNRYQTQVKWENKRRGVGF